MKRELEELLFSRYPKILEGCMGGMLSALVLTLLVLPAVYLLWKQGKVDE
jgi:Cu(I)/Ag(I) efflux system membrane protein CusA/SilA